MPTRIYNSTLIYDVVLVIVLGGIGLSGGRGGVLNVVGTLLIGTMLNGMTILGDRPAIGRPCRLTRQASARPRASEPGRRSP
ncbi:MAG: hypothetical protein LKCHEGNO_01009 [Burkholderiaceae bacterium]|nr:hypothetical protein [Burkholderiaceae bacterium]